MRSPCAQVALAGLGGHHSWAAVPGSVCCLPRLGFLLTGREAGGGGMEAGEIWLTSAEPLCFLTVAGIAKDAGRVHGGEGRRDHPSCSDPPAPQVSRELDNGTPPG